MNTLPRVPMSALPLPSFSESARIRLRALADTPMRVRNQMTEPWRAIPVVDADGHITETTEQLRPYLKGRQGERGPWTGRRSYYPEEGRARALGGRVGNKLNDARTWRGSTDQCSLETTVH